MRAEFFAEDPVSVTQRSERGGRPRRAVTASPHMTGTRPTAGPDMTGIRP